MKRITVIVAAFVLIASAVNAQTLQFNNTLKADAVEKFGTIHNLDLIYDDGIKMAGKFSGDLSNETWQNGLTQLLGPGYRWYTDSDNNVHIVAWETWRDMSLKEKQARQGQKSHASAPARDRHVNPRQAPQQWDNYYAANNVPVNRGFERPCGNYPELIGCTVGYGNGPAIRYDYRGGYSGPVSGYYGANYYGGYQYQDPIEFSRRARNMRVEELNGDKRILGNEKLLRSIDVYIDGKWIGRASDYNTRMADGTIALEEGEHTLEMVNLDTNRAVRRDIQVTPRAVRRAFGQKQEDLRVDDRTFNGGDSFPWQGTGK